MYEISDLEVYLDILFILNFVMDYFIFWMVSKITYKKVSKKKLLIGSLVAALLYCLVVIIPSLRTINIIFYLIFLPLIPIKIIFNPGSIKSWLQTFVIANITALIIGGVSYVVFYWIQEQDLIWNSYKQKYEGFSIWMLITSVVVSYIAIQCYRYYSQKRDIAMQKLYSLNILYNGQAVSMEALLDTGNKVYDPITKHPVIIVEYKIIKKLLPENIRRLYLEKEEDITQMVHEASKCEFGARIRLVPYHSLGNPNGILLGFKADRVYVNENSKEDKLVEDVIIAIYQYDLSLEDTYHALLHGDIIS